MSNRKSTRKSERDDAGFSVSDFNPELRINKITPKNDAQKHYMKKINGTSIVFGIGPAGTGKTWLAAVMAAQALKAGLINRIIVTRPAIEVGTRLGFLPGELEEKYEPYFRPVKDALEEALGKGHTEYLIKSGKIEARPLQYLRGATLKDAWVIFDEAQNSTPTEMKMFLTRYGENCKYIINGDLRQQDIPGKSGLLDAIEKLGGLSDVAICTFTRADIVRHGLVKHIIDRYEGVESEDEKGGLHRFLNN